MDNTYNTTSVMPAINKVLRNTYLLLSMTLGWSALMAYVAIATQASPMGILGIVAIFASLFGVMFTQNTFMGLPMTFLFTGLMGYFTGPLVGFYLAMPNGPELVMTALGATATIFLALSGYVLTTRKDFNAIGAFLMIGLFVCIGAMILTFFVSIPGLQMAISAMVVLVMSGFILFDTSRIIHGGEQNYIMATINLYLDILNIFIHLLSLLGYFGDD